MTYRPIPRLPIFGWDTFAGSRRSLIPCILDAPNLALTTSGRASIYQALKILGITTGTSVLIPTYHCPTMVTPVIALDAAPIFCPIDSTGQINLDSLNSLARSDTRAILAPHYFGLPQPLDKLRAWCDERGIALIEDCAHALFGISGDRNIGQWGDVTIASLTKFLPLPEGGCLVCNRDQKEYVALNNPGLLNQIRAVFDILEEGSRHQALPGGNTLLQTFFGLKRKIRGMANPMKEPRAPFAEEETDEVDGHRIDHNIANTRLTNACRWVARLAARERIVTNRRKNYAYLTHALSHSTSFHPLMPGLPDHCAPYVFPLWVERPDPAYQELRARRIPLFRWDHLWPTTPVIAGDLGIAWSHHVFQLVCHQDLREDEMNRIVANLRELCV